MRFSRRSLSTCVLAMLLAAAPTLPIAAEVRSAAIAMPALANIRIDNFGQVDAGYYRGAQPIRRDYDDLAALGIKTVIDLQRDGDPHEKDLVQQAGMTFVRIPMTTRVPPTSEQLVQFLRLVNDPAGQPVYVHCAGGRHRTGVMSAVYRMEKDGWTAAQAFAEMKRYKFGMDFLHPEFKQFVYAYHRNGRAAPTMAIASGGR